MVYPTTFQKIYIYIHPCIFPLIQQLFIDQVLRTRKEKMSEYSYYNGVDKLIINLILITCKC